MLEKEAAEGESTTDQAVTRRQGHLVQVRRVPSAKQDAPVVWPRPVNSSQVGMTSDKEADVCVFNSIA